VRHCVGVYPETKHPGYFDGIGLPMEAPLIEALRQAALSEDTGRVCIQSFEVCILKRLRTMTSLPLVQLLNDGGTPYDFVAVGDSRTYADLARPAGLAEIAGYADGIGVHKDLIIPRNADQRLGVPSSLIADAHAAGLVVHGWTFRAESAFLPVDFRSTADPAVPGDLEGEIAAFLDVGMDGFFTDQPDIGVRVRDAFLS
jgi:glycerophosphoryl diester phosphodiesterase